MATSREFTLAVRSGIKDVSAASAGSANANVIVYIDTDIPKNDVIVALEKVTRYIIEKEY